MLNELERLRQEIDKCDEAIVKNFEKRMELVMEVLAYKKEKGLPVFHPGREQQVMDKVLASFSHTNLPEEIQQLYKEIMRISRKLQSKRLFPYSIALIGFMGTGKTTVAMDLSEKLEMEYVDVDILIQEKMEMTIGEIFENYGEGYFRKIEKDTIKELSQRNNIIISSGGGAVLDQENIINLKKNCKVVLLKAAAETIIKRIKGDNTRPLVKGKMHLEHIKDLLDQRKAAYHEAADIIIDTDDKIFDDISKEIVRELLLKYE
ncbi:shikimate kinase /chorismate mutase [Natronincola peptidivorans]|uniref:Shikimate kinase n=1 Tax=Natronincola peptidivorans TaxID=426128 RepID=A0A1I0A510_9FIRM|nr:chorismate mutase [Natronincola peptidivorans]SES89195.1 shikimate kinase /chorismate mutase [Natronincola peptidivorans]